ncbi:MAG: hypothetical protein RL745_804, partial [Actinomycetota bacterium]
MSLHSDLFIDGQWVELQRRFPVYNPATGEVLAEVGDAGLTEGAAAVDAASAAFASWSQTPPRVRAEVLRRAW